MKRLIYLSSIKVNGEATNGRAFGANDPPGYYDSYGQSKWEAEERLCQITNGAAMDWVIVRPPLVYGPRVPGNFRALMRCAFRGIPLPVGSLHNSRSLVSVYNLCDLLSLLTDHPAASNSRFLVSDPEDVSTPELVRRLAAGIRQPAHSSLPGVDVVDSGKGVWKDSGNPTSLFVPCPRQTGDPRGAWMACSILP